MATKTEVNRLRSRIARLERRYTRQNNEVQQSKRNWVRSYHAYISANEQYIELKNVKTKTAAKLRKRIKGWKERSVELTRIRDERRAARDKTEQEIVALTFQANQMESKLISRQEQHDIIVDQVFLLNDVAVNALDARNGYLHERVYNHLYDRDENTRSRVTFTHSNGKRRVIALVNTIQVVDATIVQEAFDLIDAFFERMNAVTIVPELKPLYDLTRKLLTEKRSFRVGDTFNQFMALKLTKKDFRELVEAQELLKQAVRPEKTTSYARLYTREDKKSEWDRVKMS